ncbi:asparagine synthase (glutamine-hydrolyzing) [Catenulispora sp. MAP12-49]
MRSTGPALDRTALAPIEVLHHRGPDSVTTWVSPCGTVGLAQTRLAVVGVANGAQPVYDESRTVHAVVNGEFYGYREQRRELAARGHTFRTDTDSEIAVHLYEEDPDGFVGRLHGEFAFVLWDSRRRTLLAVRDRFGIKPLYYTWIDGRLVLASEIKALLSAGAARRWDAESFHDYLHACFAPDRTLFDGIFQIPPGSLLRADDEGVRVQQYWDLDYPLAEAAESLQTAGPESVERIGEEIRAAVRTRLVADVPIGFQLSGGIDSSSVVGAAAGHAALRTFTVSFPGSPLDESGTAARTATMLGAEHHEVLLDPGLRAEAAAEAVIAGEMLQENDHGTARLLLAGAISAAGLRVALAGEGGDELFCGYGHLRTDAALSSPQRLAEARKSWARLAAGPAPATLTGALDRLGFVPGWLIDRSMTTGMPSAPLLSPAFRQRFAGRDALAGLAEAAGDQLSGRAPLHQSLYLFFKTWFCNYILAAERLDMARSVEVRLPLLDDRLFEQAKRLPPAELAAEPAKRILREAMRDRLTDEVYRTAKRPFFAPPPGDARKAAARLAQHVGDGALDGVPFFEPAAVRAFLQRVEAGRGPVSAVQDRLTHLVNSVAVLHDTYLART